MTKASRARIGRRRSRISSVTTVTRPKQGYRFTKFVPEKFFNATLQGHLKFGTLEEYRQAEAGAEHRLGDVGEGIATSLTREPVHGRSFVLGTNTFHNARIEGCGVSVSRRSIAQAYVFCATRYDYRSDVHKKIAEKNPSLTHYVVFDTERFIDALGHLAAHVCPTSAHNYGGNEVTYVDSRESEYTFDELVDTSKESRRFVDAMFRKPRDFAHEEEIRFGFGPERGGPTDPLYVKDMAAHFVHLFKAAIVSCGALGA